MQIELSAKCLAGMLKHVQGPESLGSSQCMAVTLRMNVMIHWMSDFYSVLATIIISIH